MEHAMSEPLPNVTSLWNFQDAAESERRFRELLTQARDTADIDYVVQVQTQLARSRGLQREFDDAHRILDEAESALDDTCHVGRLRLSLERGRTFHSSGKKSEAFTQFLRAFVQGHRMDEENLTVDAVHMLAIVAEGDESVMWNELAIDLAERAEDPIAKRWLGALYNNIGWSYHDRDDFEGALDAWNKAEAWHMEHGRTHTQRIAKWAVGRGLRSLKRYGEALDKQQALLKEYESSGDEEAGFTREEIAENLLALGRADEAQPFFAGAYERLKENKWIAADEPERLARLKERGEGVAG